MINSKPLGRIHSEWIVPFPIIDLGQLPEGNRQSEAHRFAEEHAGELFQFEQGPLLRIALLKLSENEHVLLLNSHLFIMDGWSIRVLGLEIAAFYQSFITGQPARLPDLPLQYVDFAHWQRTWLDGTCPRIDIDYWKQRLAGMPASVAIPTDRQRAPGQPPGVCLARC
jgi:hypothetical protein